MLTGYDHLLFLVGVIFFCIAQKKYCFMWVFTIGHSITLLLGVLADMAINAYLIDAIIALSIVYKGFDNLEAFKGFRTSAQYQSGSLNLWTFHGFGLASKLQELSFDRTGLLTNLLGFNIGVEIGQFIALALVLFIITNWRRSPSFLKFSTVTNMLLMAAGFLLFGYQLVGYFNS